MASHAPTGRIPASALPCTGWLDKVTRTDLHERKCAAELHMPGSCAVFIVVKRV
jgi:hypothetical protein